MKNRYAYRIEYHALPQDLLNPVHFLSFQRVYFHSNAANHPAKAKAAMFDTDVV